MYPYHSMLQPLFDRYLLKLFEEGILERVNKALKPHQINCQAEFVAADYNFLIEVFIVLVIGILLAWLTFFFEKIGWNTYLQNMEWP